MMPRESKVMAGRRNLNNSIRSVVSSFVSTIVRIAVLAVCVLMISKVGKYAFDFGYRIFTEEPMSSAPGRDVAVTIVQGDSLKEVCQMLEEKGLVRDYKLTMIQKKVSVYDGDIEPGFYTLNTSMTADEMFEVIAGKKTEDGEEEEDVDESTMEAAPLSEGDIDTDALIDSTIPDGDIVIDPFDAVEGTDEAAEGADAEGGEGAE